MAPKPTTKGWGTPTIYGPRSEREVFIRPRGLGVPGRQSNESAPFWDQGGREPRKWARVLVRVLLRGGEEPAKPGGVALWSHVGNDIGNLARSLGGSRDMVGMFKAE